MKQNIFKIIGTHKNKLILLTPLLLGVWFLLKPQKSNITEYNNKNVTVINIKKETQFPLDKVVGIVLILSAVYGYIVLNKAKRAYTKKLNKAELTTQERKIYDLLKSGHRNKEIASELNISISTVKTHINNIFKKLDVSSRKELVD